MRSILWMTYRELSVRKASFIIGLTMCGLLISMFVSIEWSLRSRGNRVQGDIDQMGPGIVVVPPDKSIADLRQFDLGSRYFGTRELVDPLIARLSPHTRAVDVRLSVRIPTKDGKLPVVGIDPARVVSPHETLRQLGKNEVAIGRELGRRLDKQSGDVIRIAGSEFSVKTILPPAGDLSDLAAFMPVSRLQAVTGKIGKANVIRIFPESGRDFAEIRELLTDYGSRLHAVAIDRGEIAETRIPQTLASHRYAVYVLLGVFLSFSMAIWTYLDSAQRLIELATVAAVGCSPAGLVGLLVGRSAVVGAGGALLGVALIGGSKWITEGAFPGSITDLSDLLATALCGAVFFSVAGAVPVALNMSVRNYVGFLQN
ncbi:MAG: hypothetical protein K9K62_00075 [Desulfobacteraceae bacterium]|nr:hypothetical protein [Desulfobacteraceae bacterium]MCF8035242.1 hypothetical protein [Desulfobacteraceae bacterium]